MSALEDVIALAANVSALAASLPLPGLGTMTLEQRGLLATYRDQADALGDEALDATVLSALTDIDAALIGIQTRAPGHPVIAPSFLASTSNVFSPTVTGGGASTQTITPSLLASAAVVYAPTLTAGGPPGQTILPALIAAASSVYSPTLTQGAAAYAGITGTRMGFNLLISGSKYYNARVSHVATEDISVAKIALANFIISNDVEVGNGGAAVVRASIEYPAGTFTQVHFSTAPDTAGHPGDDTYGLIPAVTSAGTGATSEVGVIVSDAATLTTMIPSGAVFWTREWRNNNSGFWYCGIRDATNSEALAFSATVLSDLTTGGTVTSGGTFTALPAAVINASATKASVILLGDSIQRGLNDEALGTVGGVSTPSDVRVGVMQRGIPLTTPSLNLGGSGAKASTLYAKSPGRRVLWPYCSHAVVEPGINDIISGDSAATILANNVATLAYFPSRVRKLLSTLLPYTAGSTHYGTPTSNQSILLSGLETIRVTYNTSVRGTPSGWDDFLEMADSLEVSRSNGKWAPNTVARNVTDGVTNGTTTITSATAAFTSADQGTDLRVNGGTGSVNTQTRIVSVTNSTTIVVNNAVGASTGVTLNIGENTRDGLHPGPSGNRVSAAYVASVAATKFAYP